MKSTLEINARHEDFRIFPSGGSNGLLLIGTSPSTQGMLFQLGGYKEVEFTNATIKLTDTVWATLSGFGQANSIEGANNDATSDYYYPADESPFNNNLTQLKLNSIIKPRGSDNQSSDFEKSENSSEHSPEYIAIEQQNINGIVENSNNNSPQPKKSYQDRDPESAKSKQLNSSSGAGSGASPSDDSLLSSGNLNLLNGVDSDQEASIDYLPKILFGSRDFDNLLGAEGNDIFYTSAGNDLIKGLGGLDTLIGVDYINISINQVTQGVFNLVGELYEIFEAPIGTANYAEKINSSLYFSGIEIFKHVDEDEGIELARIVNPSNFNDSLKPFDDKKAWQVDGLTGNDVLIGGNSADDIRGGDGDDIIDSGLNSIANADMFLEFLNGGNGNDRITYQGFDTSFQAAPSIVSSYINAGSGNDLVAIKLDQLTQVNIDSGEGVDTLALNTLDEVDSIWHSNFMEWSWVFQNNQAWLTARYHSNFEAGIFESGLPFERIALGSSDSGQSYKVIRPDNATSSIITGSHTDDFILALEGKVSVFAGQGNDIVLGKQGSIISLGQGINELYSSDNHFTLSYEWSSNSVRVDLASKLGLVFEENGDLLALDRIITSPDLLIGSNSDDILLANERSNTIYGGQGNDIIVGGGGNDFIFAGDGDDILTFNGEGQSEVEGGAGADRFILDFDFSRGSSLKINDLEFSQGDRISINLASLSQQTNYGSFRIMDSSGSLIFENELYTDEQAILNLVLNKEEGILSFDNGFTQTEFMFVNDSFDGLSAEQLATLINVDYI